MHLCFLDCPVFISPGLFSLVLLGLIVSMCVCPAPIVDCPVFPSLKTDYYYMSSRSSQEIVTEHLTKNSYLRVFPSICFHVFPSVFVFLLSMDPFIRPEFLLLLLEQGDRFLEEHTRLVWLLASTTSYLDDTLWSLNTESRAPSSEYGPQEDFVASVEWNLNTIHHLPHGWSHQIQMPNPSSPHGVEHQPAPTSYREHYIYPSFIYLMLLSSLQMRNTVISIVQYLLSLLKPLRLTSQS